MGILGVFHYQLQPRFSETDGLGHINNSVLPVWLEEARTGIFRIFNPSLDFEDWNLILKKYEIEFIAQISRDPEVEIESGIAHVGNTSVVVAQTVMQAGKPVARGTTVLVHFDYKAGKPSPIPPRVREMLEAHHLPSAG